jgi:nanoRNase/pAp phosphatase (c-di-AMP/oligoRNAs hydrolase)
VGAIAASFGGGGHKLAAGVRSMLPMAELEDKLLAAIEQALIKI